MANNWETTVKITVPKGTNGWQQTGRVRVNGRDYKFPIGVQTQLPKPVAEYVQALIDQDKSIEEAKKRNPFSSPHQVLVTDSDGNPVWEDRTLWTALAAICPEALTDPDVKILYKPGVTEIGEYEFKANTEIDVVYFPNVETIGRFAFQASSLRVAIFPNAETVEPSCFYNCVKLEGAYFPKATQISASMFQGCTTLNNVVAPEATSCEQNAFYGCSSLESVSLPKVTELPDSGQFNNCRALRDVDLPEAKTINASFNNCKALEKIDLPKVETLNNGVFRNSSALTAVILRGETVCALNSITAFTGTPIASGTGYIYVPSALIEDYKVATNWSTYAAQLRTIEDYPDICDPTMDEPITKGEAAALIDSKLEGAGGGSGGAFVVTAESEDEETFTVDKTLDEIYAAADAGMEIVCKVCVNYDEYTDIAWYQNMSWTDGGVIFTRNDSGHGAMKWLGFKITENKIGYCNDEELSVARLYIAMAGYFMRSTDNSLWRVKIGNDGQLTTEKV